VSLAGPRFSNDDNVLPTLNIFALEQRPDKALVDGRLGGKVEALDCLDDRKTRLAYLALTRAAPQILPDDDAQIDDKDLSLNDRASWRGPVYE